MPVARIIPAAATAIVVAAAIVLTALPQSARALDLANCHNPLGLESGRIPDSSISASSSYDAGNVGPQFARLRHDRNGGAWCPKQQVMRGIKEWIEVDLKRLHCIAAIQTQGRFGNGQGQEYAEEYKIEYWRPGMERWVKYRDRSGSEILAGNTNTYTVAENRFDPAIVASKIRLVPYSLHRRTVCLRWELFGCHFQEGVVSYSSPQGDVLDDIDLIDDMYDGISDNGFLKGGLGQLMDGRIGHDNIDVDVSQHGKGYEWVGWKNKSFEAASSTSSATAASLSGSGGGRSLELIFEFDSVRNFSRVDIYTNNDFRRDVQVFSQLRVFFSIGGRKFADDQMIEYVYMPDLMIDRARNVTVHLRHQVARYLKLQFEFASQWILISEVYFQSEPVEGNFSEEIRAGGSPVTDIENHLQRDTVFNSKTSEEPSVAIATDQDAGSVSSVGSHGSSHTGVVIGVMTVIIIALVGAIVTMSLRNCRQNGGGRSILPASFGAVTLKEMGLGFKSSTGDFFGGHHHASASPAMMNSAAEPLYASVKMDDSADAIASNCGKQSAAIYNEPFGCTPETDYSAAAPAAVYAIPSKNFRRPVTPQSTEDDDLYATAELLAPYPPLALIPADRIQLIQRLGSGNFGRADLARLIIDDQSAISVMIRHFPPHFSSLEIAEECKLLCQLRHDNLLQVLGLTEANERTDEPCDANPSLVLDYGPVCDLCQFLQDHVAETSPINGRILSYGCLIYMAKQAAAAMEHLEANNVVHRDLASRNCLVSANYTVKIATFGMNRDLYGSDYFHADNQWLPVRWMAWEAVALGKYSTRSDVWSFAVLLWEILSFAREQPLEPLSDEDVLHLLMDYPRHSSTCSPDQVLLPKPILCPKEIYDLMCECWQASDKDRPTFREIHMFLSRKNLGYDPATN